MDAEPGEEVLQDLYAWIDQIPLSRPKRSVARDFSDGGYVQVPKVYSYTNEASEQRRLDWTCSQTDRPKQKPSSHVDPAFLLLMEEKEQALLALQETMEILQMKVNRLEHLVHLKDLRIDDLTRQLERYKSRAHMK
uniref:Uncharacterized protein n=1 Tax=Lepisosteus oculatus TaxID=7918 RepID=W5MA54_LEPOC